MLTAQLCNVKGCNMLMCFVCGDMVQCLFSVLPEGNVPLQPRSALPDVSLPLREESFDRAGIFGKLVTM